MTAPETEKNIREAVARLLAVPPDSFELEGLEGHASARRYVRVILGRTRRLMVMVLPPDALESEEASGDETSGELPFVNVQRYLSELGVRVPAVHQVDLERGLVITEDLGDETLELALALSLNADKTRDDLYGWAVDTLAYMRRRAEDQPREDCIAFHRSFDYDLLRWELDHFLEWGLVAAEGATLTTTEKEVVDHDFDEIAHRLSELPQGFVHRDYQSRNLMVIAGELAIIDFQDALLGPLVYDLVALLRDSYIVLPWEFVERTKARFLDGYRSLGGQPPEPEEFDEWFDLQTVQRKLKDAGRFVFIDKVKHNDSFLESIAPSQRYAADALGRLPQYGDLHEILAGHVPGLRA